MATASKASIKNSARRIGRSRIPKYATDIAAGAFIEISCAPKGKSIGIKVEANFRAHRIALLLARRQNENAPGDLNMVLEMISKIIRLQYFRRKLVAFELVVRKDFDILRPGHDTNRLTVVKYIASIISECDMPSVAPQIDPAAGPIFSHSSLEA